MSVSQLLAGRFFKEETIFEVEVYPSTPENVQQAAALVPDAVNRLQVVHYGMDRVECRKD